MKDSDNSYQALSVDAGFVDAGARTQIEVAGQDRTAFLHNMCTQDVKRLAPGEGSEAFFTDAKGHVLAFVDLFVAPSSIVIETVPEQGEAIVAHLDKYIIREDVELTRRDEQWAQLLVAGQQSSEVLRKIASAPLPERPWQHVPNRIADCDVYVRRVLHVGPTSMAIVCEHTIRDEVAAALEGAGMVRCEDEVFETRRIESKTPWFGKDITSRNLPQELDRNATAISFNKGCYIGQETIARLDALGHVNKLLVAIKFDGTQVPPPGTALSADGQAVGEVTSSTFSPQHDAPFALAYVRHALTATGSRLESLVGEAEVV
ncbi:MAG: hypothetical protein MI757_20260 [Pirellulales bacterium]|nr:hypothetical protein [Pirellulales bacterium]